MAAHRSILLKLDVRLAGKACRCRHNKQHAIARGERRLVVKVPGPGSPEHGYCSVCAKAMLDQAGDRLRALQADLENDSAQ